MARGKRNRAPLGSGLSSRDCRREATPSGHKGRKTPAVRSVTHWAFCVVIVDCCGRGSSKACAKPGSRATGRVRENSGHVVWKEKKKQWSNAYDGPTPPWEVGRGIGRHTRAQLPIHTPGLSKSSIPWLRVWKAWGDVCIVYVCVCVLVCRWVLGYITSTMRGGVFVCVCPCRCA